MTVIIIVAALLLNIWLGDPIKWHPLQLFDRMIQWIESLFIFGQNQNSKELQYFGVLAVFLLTIPIAYIVFFVASLNSISILIDIVVLYLALRFNVLRTQAIEVASKIEMRDFESAKDGLYQLRVSSNKKLSRDEIVSLFLKATLIRGNDFIFAVIFWYILLGAAGVVLYSLINNIHQAWRADYDRYREFGVFAARVYEFLHWIPSRLTALTYAFLGDFKTALYCWRIQVAHWRTEKSDVLVAVGAGALNIQLFTDTQEHPTTESFVLGQGAMPIPDDFGRALQLIQNGIWFWLLLLAGFVGGYYLM